MSSYHYLYRITNLVEQKHYYGIRTSKTTLPQDDLGKKYFSSSQDKNFKQDQKEHPENYRYKIIIVSDSRERVAELEIKLHQKFNVGTNLKFYNRAIHTSTGFDTSGKVAMRDKYGIYYHVSTDDPRIKSGELQYIAKGLLIAKDKDGNCIQVSIDDPRLETGELQQYNKGKKYIYNLELRQNTFIKPDVELPEGWSYGLKRFNCDGIPSKIKGLLWVYNTETKQNIRINPDEDLPIGWSYGRLDKFGEKFRTASTKNRKFINNPALRQNKMVDPNEPLQDGWFYGRKDFKMTNKNNSYRGAKKIYSPELKINRMIKQDEELPEGWFYGQINEFGDKFIPPILEKGSKSIYNLELKKNKFIKPNEELPEGWQYGKKLSWD